MFLPFHRALPLLCLALCFASAGQANEIRFDQSNPTILHLNITQIGNDHSVHGFDPNSGKADRASGASLTGNFGTVTLRQDTAESSAIALRVEVDGWKPSDIDIDLSGRGGHSVSLDAKAARLESLITLEGKGEKSVDLTVAATGKAVTHDITLRGKAMTLTAWQGAAAGLVVDLKAKGPGASTVITQSGENSTANISGTLHSNATLEFNQTGSNADINLAVTLKPDSKLIYNQQADNGATVSPISVKLTHDEVVTMTHTAF
ncbi:hypothetical protein [Pontibaca salina]|uniref:Auto-transporter adhesin head GIN domain-containing protein n=1 Tax=Pontibaca salina TaxID=2795731 RepID=A0A934HT87_9RHOB|nr:hypothetical protein [Pontibaca salina]MBI6629184.1 hypothetical protein [Pontibaca salina]